MTKTYFIHNPVNGSLTGDFESFWILKEKCLIHADMSIGIIAFILSMDCAHSISKSLIFPGVVFLSKIFVKTLAADTEHSAIE